MVYSGAQLEEPGNDNAHWNPQTLHLGHLVRRRPLVATKVTGD